LFKMQLVKSVHLAAFCSLCIASVVLTIIVTFTLRPYFYDLMHRSNTFDKNSAWLINRETVTYRKYYFFDIKNPSEILDGEKPVLVERGPYTFREENHRHNIEHLDNNRTSFSLVKTLYFEPELSVGNKTDLIVFLNVPAMGMIETSDKNTRFPYNSILKLYNIKLFIKKSVDEMVSGYVDPLLQMARFVQPEISEKFGVFQSNSTKYCDYVVSDQDSEIESWNGLNKLNYWLSDQANEINGTDGSQFGPISNENQSLFVFLPESCRSLRLEYHSIKSINGTETFEYRLPKDIFSKSDQEFCSGKSCIGNGVFSISKCRKNLPMYTSLPHFLNADQKFIDGVDGLRPNLETHDWSLNIEPV